MRTGGSIAAIFWRGRPSSRRGADGGGVAVDLGPNYAWAQQVAKDDPRLKTEYLEYASPKGAGKMRGYLVRPASATGKLPAVVVIHENRGLNPYIEDVTRRLGDRGIPGLCPRRPDAAGRLSGQRRSRAGAAEKRDSEEMTQDFIAAAELLQKHAASSGKVGVVGFCYGGGVANTLAVRIPDVIAAAVPFYGRQPATEDVPKIKASLLIHYAELDKRSERRLAGLRTGPEGGQGALRGAHLPGREPRLSQRHDAAL